MPASYGAPEAREQVERLGVPGPVAERLVRSYGGDAAARLSDDPWLVLTDPAVTPAQADGFARRTDRSAAPGDPRRVRALCRWLLDRAAGDGHTLVASSTLLSALHGLGVPDPPAAVTAVVRSGALTAVGAPGEAADAFALPRVAAAEESLAEDLHRLAEAGAELGAPHGVLLVAGPACPARDAAVRALVERSGVAQALEVDAAAHPRAGRAGLDRLRGEQAWDGLELLVVHSAERLGLLTAAALLDAVPDECGLVLAGDPAALAGVPGRVMADLVESGLLPVVEVPDDRDGPLGELDRGLRAGRLPAVDPADREVVVVVVESGEQAVHRTGQLVGRSIPGHFGLGPRDVAVVTLRAGGAAGAEALSAALGGAGTTVLTVAEAAGGRWPAVVLVLAPEAAGGLGVPMLLSAVGAAERHLSVVTGLGRELAAVVSAGAPPHPATRLRDLLAEPAEP